MDWQYLAIAICSLPLIGAALVVILWMTPEENIK